MLGGTDATPGRRASSKALPPTQRHCCRPKSGLNFKELFTIRRLRRYVGTMLLLAAAAIALAHPSHPASNYHSDGHRPGSLIAEATATVRIVSGVRITATGRPAGARLDTIPLPAADGQSHLARLVEFE
jgi:hypothetical protein